MKYIPNAVTFRVARTALLARKHSPILMFGAGVAGSLTATVLACKSTLRLEEVLAEAERDKGLAQKARDEHPDRYSEEDQHGDERTIRMRTAFNIAKLYAPAVVVGVVSYGLLTGAHVVLTKRNTAVTAAFVAVDKAFKQYRERVRNELGEEKDNEFRYGVVEREIVEEGEHGHEVRRIKQVDPLTGRSMYAQCFGSLNKNWQRAPGANRLFIQAQQLWANDLLQTRGHVFLNDVYDMLGFERTKAGAVVGWVKNNGDNYIDFGMHDTKREVWEFFEGIENSVWLDFNVDGVVYDRI